MQCWFAALLVCCLAGLLPCWFAALLVCYCAALRLRCLTALLPCGFSALLTCRLVALLFRFAALNLIFNGGMTARPDPVFIPTFLVGIPLLLFYTACLVFARFETQK